VVDAAGVELFRMLLIPRSLTLPRVLVIEWYQLDRTLSRAGGTDRQLVMAHSPTGFRVFKMTWFPSFPFPSPSKKVLGVSRPQRKSSGRLH
jgi:hypothetical protein